MYIYLNSFETMHKQQRFEQAEEDPDADPAVTDVDPLKISQTKYNSFLKLIFIITNISLSSFYFGYTILYLNVIDFDTIMSIFQINMSKGNAEGVVTFCVPVGGLIGSYFSSYFMANYSRRTSILIINGAAFVIGCFVFIPNFYLYMFVRVLQGVCAGLFSALVPLIIKQLSPMQLSGILGVFHQLFICLGIFSACFIYYILSVVTSDATGSSFWKLIFGIPLIVIFVQSIMLLFVFTHETPPYLIQKGHQEQAIDLIKVIYKDQYVSQIFNELKRQLQAENQIEMKNKDPQDGEKQPQDLKQPPYQSQKIQVSTFVALHLALLQQFVGISAVATFAGEIASGSLISYKPVLPSIINFEQVVTAVISSCLLSKIGRKKILQAGTVGAIITNCLIAAGFFLLKSHEQLSVGLILVGLFLFMASFGLSLGPVVWLYIPEIVEARILPYSTMVNWGGSALTILLFPIIKENLLSDNPAMLFIFFAAWSFISFFINAKYVIETKDRSKLEIMAVYSKMMPK